MRAVNAILAGVSLVAIGFAANAQTLRSVRGPAEIPPASYTQSYYVDSRGCAFIRAGYGGNVTWVPRVHRSKQVVCGQTPTRVAGAARPAPATRVAAQPAAKPSAAPRKPSTVLTWTTPRPAPTTARVAIAPTPAPVPTARPAAPVKVVVARPQATFQARQPAASGVYAIRTGPQPIHPGDYVNGRLGVKPAAAPGTRQVTRVEVTRLSPAPVPKGYKSLLAEDKVNPRYGVGTAIGKAQMDLVWTETMPRRLIDVTTGRDVTTVYTTIQYPYTSTTQSSRSYAEANAGAQTHRPVQSRRSTKNDAAAPRAVSAGGGEIARTFIQVATFGEPANAAQTLRRFTAAGIPAGTRALRRNGKEYRIVLLGPFTANAPLQSALGAARRAGFGDAFYVR